MKFLSKYESKPSKLLGNLFWNFLFGSIPFFVLFGILILSGSFPVSFNGEPTTGLKGFIVFLIYSPLLVFSFAITVWIYYLIGNYLLKTFNRII